MTTFTTGQQVRIKPTGDEDIDKYIGQTGTIVLIEVDRHYPGHTHYTVEMDDLTILVVNEDEFEAVQE